MTLCTFYRVAALVEWAANLLTQKPLQTLMSGPHEVGALRIGMAVCDFARLPFELPAPHAATLSKSLEE